MGPMRYPTLTGSKLTISMLLVRLVKVCAVGSLSFSFADQDHSHSTFSRTCNVKKEARDPRE